MESEIKIYYGHVIFFNKLWGFIEWHIDNKKQKDLFVHFSDIVGTGFRILKKNQQVSFNLGINKYNQPKAINVTILNE